MTGCCYEANDTDRSGAGDETTRSDHVGAMAKEITWYQAAAIIDISCRQMRRWKGYIAPAISFLPKSWRSGGGKALNAGGAGAENGAASSR